MTKYQFKIMVPPPMVPVFASDFEYDTVEAAIEAATKLVDGPPEDAPFNQDNADVLIVANDGTTAKKPPELDT